ncbi:MULTISPECIES: hypothetical protein [unclassified Rhodococcus (in: high G+C Gram-positive bacteria)]|uniref:hypothetical protein n=1 Tax=unclassified Rhodococcus (in: high G+C Gram-positive bacteria) TaxID=192944 RepID=UPI0006FA6963|nr:MULTISPECIES: hypothetical protein [unclassified Rhodococcus (in: high G+C Gram-positive bacteria)]KQU30320.1 hypothetical protein ASG69_04485 [Rhodococcus sp. Leaf225]KQU44775.1 hypothetical protein ASH03_12655 [Rhodococcus sp. Leaf258]
MTVTVITCRGLFEAVSDRNMLSNLTNRLDHSRFRVEEFGPWAAAFGDYDVALERTSRALAERIRVEPGPVVLAGYSGGAHVVKRALLDLTGKEREKVARVVLCADPSMPRWSGNRGDQVVGSRRILATGIAGDEELWMPSGVTYVADRGDPIPFTPDGSPLHTLAAFLTALGPGKEMPLRMRVKLAAAAASRRYDLGAYGEAVALFNAYAFGQAHQRPYPALLARVGDDINWEVHG